MTRLFLAYNAISGTSCGWSTHSSIYAGCVCRQVSVFGITWKTPDTHIRSSRLRSGATATTGAVRASYFEVARTMPIDLSAPPLPGGNNPGVDPGLMFIFPRVMECLGSVTNNANFIGLRVPIHQAKTSVSRYYYSPL